MADFNMYAKMGTQAIGALGQASIQQDQNKITEIQHKMQTSAQAHRNVLMGMSAARQQNNVALAQAQVADQSKRLEFNISLQALKHKSQAQVSAAAAGVSGRSVDATLQGLRRSEIQAQFARVQNRNAQQAALRQNTRDIKMNAILGKDTTIIPRPVLPDASSALLGLTTSLIDTWDQNNPEGHRTTDAELGFFSG